MNNIVLFSNNIELIMDDIINNLRAFISNLMSNICDTKLMLDLFQPDENKLKVIEPNTTVYDIYYYLLLLQKDNQLKSFIVDNFEYPESFSVKVINSDYRIKITAFDNKKCTCIVLFDKPIIINKLGYIDAYKFHNTYDSIICELYSLKSWI